MNMTPKLRRTLKRNIDSLFKTDSYVVPQTIDDFKVDNLISKELELDNGKIIILTDAGLDSLDDIAAIIEDSNIYNGLAAFSEIHSACRRVLINLLSEMLRPENIEEFLDLVSELINPQIVSRTFAVPLYGLQLSGIEKAEIGTIAITDSPLPMIKSLGIAHDLLNIDDMIENMAPYLWVIGNVTGSERISQQKFRAKIELYIGFLAVVAASSYEGGSRGFRFGVIMNPEEAYGDATWLSWSESDKQITAHNSYAKSQLFTIDAQLLEEIDENPLIKHSFTIIEKKTRTEFEETIAKALYWFSDAQRDLVPVMKLIKYWSCIEAFFSSGNGNITESVTTGLTTALVYAGNSFYEKIEYAELKKRISKLYNYRSRALHGASYQSVSVEEFAELSQWTAWMLTIMISLSAQGIENLNDLNDHFKKINKHTTIESPQSTRLGFFRFLNKPRALNGSTST